MMFDATRRFQSAQFVTHFQLYTQTATLVLHVIWCNLFIGKWQLGAVGAAICIDLTYCSNMVILDILSAKHEVLRKSWKLIPDGTVIQRLGDYIKVGFPGAMMTCFEWWLFEILALLAGLMSNEALAAEVILVTFVSFVFMVPLGCSFAASAFAGFFCACGKISEAKKYTRLTVLFGCFITCIMLLLLYLF